MKVKRFFDTELWRWIKTLLEICGMAAAILLVAEVARWLMEGGR